jgi:hypothetical protein
MIEYASKAYVDEYDKAAATTLRHVSWWINAGRQLIIEDLWFGSLPTVLALKQHRLDFIGNMKNCTAGFCEELFSSTMRPGATDLQHDDQAFKKMPMSIAGKEVAVLAAQRTDKQPMALISTTSKSDPAPPC